MELDSDGEIQLRSDTDKPFGADPDLSEIGGQHAATQRPADNTVQRYFACSQLLYNIPILWCSPEVLGVRHSQHAQSLIGTLTRTKAAYYAR